MWGVGGGALMNAFILLFGATPETLGLARGDAHSDAPRRVPHAATPPRPTSLFSARARINGRAPALPAI